MTEPGPPERVRGASVQKRLRELSKLTLPLLAENFFIVFMGMVSTALVASLGEEALGATGFINNAANLPIGIFAAMATGGTIVVAQAIGAGNRDKAHAAAGQAVVLSLIVSLVMAGALALARWPVLRGLFRDSDPLLIEFGHIFYMYTLASIPLMAIFQTLFGVLRAAGNTKTPMFISLFMNAVNLVVGFILIIGIRVPLVGWQTPTFGMHGAGIAIVLGRLAGVLVASRLIVAKKSIIRLNRLTHFRPTRPIHREILSLGIPAGIESSMFHIGKLLTQLLLVGMGTAAMAANAVNGQISGLILVPGSALSVSIMVQVGQRAGRKEIDDIPKTTMFSVAVCAVIMTVICLALLPMTGVFTSFYNLEGDSVGYFRLIFISSLIATPPIWGMSFIVPSALRAVKDATYTMVVASVTMWVFRIAIGFLFIWWLDLGVLGLWLAMYLDWAARSVLYTVRLLRRKWVRKIVREV